MSQTRHGLAWVHQSLVGSGMHLHVLTDLLVRKGIVSRDEVTEALTAFSRDDYIYNTRRVLEDPESELRDGEWRHGGVQATRDLAKAAGITADTKVLDICCGMGGPARVLAEEIGCTVCGIDKDFARITEAIRRNTDIEIARRVEFKWGDAEEVPYPDGAFDVVIGQASWDQVPDKRKLLQECRRVLKRPGTVAFEPYAILDEVSEETFDRMEKADLERYGKSLCFRIGSWRALLRDQGFEQVSVTALWEETRRYGPAIGDGREIQDIRDAACFRVVART